MEFIDFKPKRGNNYGVYGNNIRVFFYSRQKIKSKFYTQIGIGKNICEKMGLKDGDKVVFSCSKHDPKIWLIRKTDADGYKLGCPSNNDNTLRFVVSLPYPPQEFEKKTHVVRHDFYEGGIRVFSGVDPAQDEQEQKE